MFPKYERCGSQVPPWCIGNWHSESKKLRLGEELRIRWATLQHCFDSRQVLTSVNADPLEPAAAFPYLGHTVKYNNSDWADLYQNLLKARRWWEMMGKVVMKKGATVRARVMLYNAIVQSVQLYGRKNWVVMGDMIKVPEGLHHWESIRIAGMKARCTTYGRVGVVPGG